MQRCLRWQVSRTRRAGEALLPRSPSAQRGASAGVAGTARWRKCGPAAQRRANGVAYSADIRASGLLRRLPEVLPRGLRRLWDGAPCPITLAQFPARQHLAGKIRFSGPALYYNYPLFTRSDAPFGSTTAVRPGCRSIPPVGTFLERAPRGRAAAQKSEVCAQNASGCGDAPFAARARLGTHVPAAHAFPQRRRQTGRHRILSVECFQRDTALVLIGQRERWLAASL